MCKSRLLFVISIHAPTRGATFFVAFSLLLYLHFNPRSHEGSDGTDGGSRLNLPISIHAPTRGATPLMRSEYRALRISIHAPTRGATRFLSEDALFPLDFNPRSHEGSDSTSFTLSLILSDFNPRSHEGSDEINRMQVLHLRLFQSTLPRGERLQH